MKTRRRWGVGLAVAGLAMAVLPCPISSATPTSGTLVLSSGSGEPGEWVAMRGRIPTDTRTMVELERIDADGFVTVATAKTDRRGRFAFTTRVPADRTTASYRVASPGGVTAVRSVVTGTTTRLTQDPDPTKEPIDRIGAALAGMSGDGRFVYYHNSQDTAFVWDRSSHAAQPLADQGLGIISPSYDGRFLAHATGYTTCGSKNLDGGVAILDTTTGTSASIGEGIAGHLWPTISAGGTRVAFQSCSARLAGRDRNHAYDIFVGDAQSGQVQRATAGNAASWDPDLSADGRWVVFTSLASDLVTHDTNHHADVFLWDSRTGKLVRVSRPHQVGTSASVSETGRYIAYLSAEARKDRPSQMKDVYVWDRLTGRSTRVTAVTANTRDPQISDDGRHVVYSTPASDIVQGDGNFEGKVLFVWDRTTRTSTRIVNNLNSLYPLISADGAHVAYTSGDLDMINGPPDVYLWDRLN